MRHCGGAVVALLIVAGVSACSRAPAYSGGDAVRLSHANISEARADAFRRAAVWRPTRVETADIRLGPHEAGGFGFLENVACDYVDKPLRGHSLKFACRIGDADVVKVKIGRTNGEVYGEVAATRLLWALGFGADRMYHVRLTCRGCPARFTGEPSGSGGTLFDPAVIERPIAGATFDDDPGWSWSDLDRVDGRSGGAPRAHRDALKLLAVFLQHTDNKTEQQRLVCLGEPAGSDGARCRSPFLLIDDAGLTFGSANFLNDNAMGGANFQNWAETPIWKDTRVCIGNLSPSLTGTLANPRISEEGRQFLASLMMRLSERQIRDLFEVSRFDLRQPSGSGATIDDWVRAFEAKREQIAARRCD